MIESGTVLGNWCYVCEIICKYSACGNCKELKEQDKEDER